MHDNLSPGTYRFQAVGYTGGGLEGNPPQELAFRVLPPLWLRPWAIALEVLLFVGLAWALAGLRTPAPAAAPAPHAGRDRHPNSRNL